MFVHYYFVFVFQFIIIETKLQTDFGHTKFEAQFSLLITYTLIKT